MNRLVQTVKGKIMGVEISPSIVVLIVESGGKFFAVPRAQRRNQPGGPDDLLLVDDVSTMNFTAPGRSSLTEAVNAAQEWADKQVEEMLSAGKYISTMTFTVGGKPRTIQRRFKTVEELNADVENSRRNSEGSETRLLTSTKDVAVLVQ